MLSRWIFKGGTCLKKCYFDTYRFSEDLDFTLPGDSSLKSTHDGLRTVGAWVSNTTGIEVPEDGIEVEESFNKLGQVTYLAKLAFGDRSGFRSNNDSESGLTSPRTN